MMGTIVEITIKDVSYEKAKNASEKAFTKISEIEKVLSAYDNKSEISRLNRTGEVKNPSLYLKEVTREAILAGNVTKGAFDITLAPVISLWGFGPAKKVSSVKYQVSSEIPGKKDIEKAMKLVNYKDMVFDEKNNTIYFKKKGMSVNLGGIAKGYAVDKAIEVLKSQGIKKAIVNAGGNMYAMGTTWCIGIKDPRKENIFKTIRVKDRAVSTSGDYERFFTGIEAGKKKKFHHIIDPRTGYPAGDCISVTVIAPTGMMSDWLSTGVFVMGPEKGLALLSKLGIKGVIVTRDEKIISN